MHMGKNNQKGKQNTTSNQHILAPSHSVIIFVVPEAPSVAEIPHKSQFSMPISLSQPLLTEAKNCFLQFLHTQPNRNQASNCSKTKGYHSPTSKQSLGNENWKEKDEI